MNTFDFTEIQLQHLITHHVGNKLRDEKNRLSIEQSTFAEETKHFLLKYFLLPIKQDEFFSFSHSVKLSLNEVYTIIQDMFSKPKSFVRLSQNIAKLLYEYSMHPKIKEGELNIVYFSNVVLNGELIDAIGIFKSEVDVPFIKMKKEKTKFRISHDFGFELKGIDKGCLIFNTSSKHGYKILIVGNSNKSDEAQYWKDDFLKLKPISNEFYQTKQFLDITKEFVTKQLLEEFEISKPDKIDLLNRSVEYFKMNENFDRSDFEKKVLQNSGIIKSFRNFDSTYRVKNDINLTDNFEISRQAVKKQARAFKSVLKLDKNFHIYIHGNRELIEQGVEKDGRKFYKIYFHEEL
ncbi:MAG: nucleoid-associated protein [Leptospiraceae bacterium]|nr:nucleoid-associated protein [Leptospiraceae bacterium]